MHYETTLVIYTTIITLLPIDSKLIYIYALCTGKILVKILNYFQLLSKFMK